MAEFRVTAEHRNTSVNAIVEADDEEDAMTKVSLHPDATKEATPIVEVNDETLDNDNEGPVEGEPL